MVDFPRNASDFRAVSYQKSRGHKIINCSGEWQSESTRIVLPIGADGKIDLVVKNTSAHWQTLQIVTHIWFEGFYVKPYKM